MLDYSPPRTRTLGVTATDPSAVFVVKSLLYPVAAVCTLVGCLCAWQEPFSRAYFLVAVMAFFGAADILDVAPVHRAQTGVASFRSFVDVLIRWALVIAFIWVLLRLSGIGGQLNSNVLLSWALTTPVALWSGQRTAQVVLS